MKINKFILLSMFVINQTFSMDKMEEEENDQKIHKILDNKNINIKDNIESSALIRASHIGHLEIAKILIDSRSDINRQDLYGNTALIVAKNGHLEIVKALVDAGADLNMQDYSYGDTALMMAAFSGHIKIANLLILAAANLNAQGKYGDTALISAASNGHLEIVKALISAGANINIINKSGETALDIAKKRNCMEIAIFLEPFVNKLFRISQIEMPKNEILEKLNLRDIGKLRLISKTFKKLLDSEPYKSFINNKKKNAYSIIQKMIDDKKIGISVIRNINSIDKDGYTALILATMEGHLELVQALINAGADLNIQGCSSYGDTALGIAASYGYTEIVKLLITVGADVNNTKTEYKKDTTFNKRLSKRLCRNSKNAY